MLLNIQGLAQKAKKDWVKELCVNNKELAEKKMLWDYLTHVMTKWKGDVVMMGDFNEVRKKAVRFGSVFNVQVIIEYLNSSYLGLRKKYRLSLKNDMSPRDKMDNPNITMEEYIKLEEEKARRHGKVYNWETAKYGKIWYDEDVHDLRSAETEFPAIVFNDELSSKKHSLVNPRLSIRHIQTPWIRRIDVMDVIQSLFSAQSIRLIMEYLVKISKKARILELNQRHLKNTILTSNTLFLIFGQTALLSSVNLLADSNVIPDSPDMCDNDIQNDQNVVECDYERVVLANLIANLKLDIDENKKIQKQLKKANASLTQELIECKSILAETSRTLGESNSI
ncbi:hypothetical protein Tco_0331897 [Tanacetum coccineum]